jgi:predicted HD phosphohydrolase
MGDDGRDAAADKLRQRIAEEAARMVAKGSDTTRSRFRAARRVARGWVPEEQLPSHEQIRQEVNRVTGSSSGSKQSGGDRLDRIAEIVRMLEHVKQNPVKHPEGDVLEHTLQVFDRVHEERPFDEELLTAALVHDLGRAIDRVNPVTSGVAALGDLITPRTRWLVETLADAAAYAQQTIGVRARQRLEGHPDFLDVLLLAECDQKACVRGYDAMSLDEAIDILRTLAAEDEADGE